MLFNWREGTWRVVLLVNDSRQEHQDRELIDNDLDHLEQLEWQHLHFLE